jgi:hypothetical protein
MDPILERRSALQPGSRSYRLLAVPVLMVSDHPREIVEVAKAESRGIGGLSPLPQITSIAVFFASALYTFDWFGNPFYHVLGFATALGAVVVVVYAIEPGIVSCSSDARFTEYGLLSCFQYEYVFLRRGVGRWGWLMNVKAVGKILFSAVLPPYGFSILVMLPFEYLETRKTIRIMEKSYQVGDEVGTMINAGRTKDELREYFSSRIMGRSQRTGSSSKTL